MIGGLIAAGLMCMVTSVSRAGFAGKAWGGGAAIPARHERSSPWAKGNRAERTVRYRLTVRNNSVEAIHGAELRVYAPAPHTPTQRVLKLTASQHFDSQRDELGNQALTFRIDLAQFGAKIISITATIAFNDSPEPTELPRPEDFIKAEPFVEVENPRIRGVAAELTESSGDSPSGAASGRPAAASSGPEQLARAAYEYVAGHVAESPYEPEDRGALYALEHGKGDCTESMYLFIALMRARGIPARGVEGFVINGNAVLRSDSYHDWAEYYADGAWHIADPQQRVFGDAHRGHYLAMRILGVTGTEPPRRWRRFEVSRSEIEVRME